MTGKYCHTSCHFMTFVIKHIYMLNAKDLVMCTYSQIFRERRIKINCMVKNVDGIDF